MLHARVTAAAIRADEASARLGPTPAARALRTQARAATLATAAFFALFLVLNFSPARSVTVHVLPLAAAAVAGVAFRRRPEFSCVAIMWLWLVVPEVRRLSDWVNGFQSESTWLVAPAVASLIALAVGVRRRISVDLTRLQGLLLVAVVLGLSLALMTGVVVNGLSAAAAGAFTWMSPLFFALLLVVHGADQRTFDNLVRFVFLPWLLIAGVYGIVQYYVLPPWDEVWMRGVAPALDSIGYPFPQEFRPWSVSNAPGPFAALVVALVLASSKAIAECRWLAILVMPALVALALSLVRASWIALVIVVIVAVVLGVLRARAVAAWTALLGLGAVAVPPETYVIITERLTTLSEGSQDQSLTERLLFHAEALPVIFSSPFGSGFGGSGTAIRFGSGSSAGGGFADRANFDGGFLEILFTLGPILGAAVLLLLTGRVIGMLFSGSRSPSEAVAGAAALTLFLQLFFGNTFTGVQGVVFFSLLLIRWVPPGESRSQDLGRVPASSGRAVPRPILLGRR